MDGNSIGQAGAATISITPPHPVPTYGGKHLVRGQEDSDILAHAVVFSDGDQTSAVVSADVLVIDRCTILWIKELASLRTGIPQDNIFVGATHSHAAPAVSPTFRAGDQPDPFYADFMVTQIAAAIEQAHSEMRPARIATGDAPTRGLTFNRRLVRPSGIIIHTVVFQERPEANDLDPDYPPEGPVDEDVGYILFEEPDGSPIACLMSFSCHNHSSCVNYFHRDLFGRAGDMVRRKLAVDIPTPFLAGACGDTMWVNPKASLPKDSLAYTWELGEKIADAVLTDVQGRERADITGIRVESQVMEIPDRSFEDSEFCEDNCRGWDVPSRQFAMSRYGPEKFVLVDRGDTSCLVEIGAISIGDSVAISTNPAELFVAFGLEIKERSPFDVTIISELTNGYCGYVPTEKAFKGKGYETHRSTFQSRLVKSGGRIITDTAVELLERCKNGA